MRGTARRAPAAIASISRSESTCCGRDDALDAREKLRRHDATTVVTSGSDEPGVDEAEQLEVLASDHQVDRAPRRVRTSRRSTSGSAATSTYIPSGAPGPPASGTALATRPAARHASSSQSTTQQRAIVLEPADDRRPRTHPRGVRRSRYSAVINEHAERPQLQSRRRPSVASRGLGRVPVTDRPPRRRARARRRSDHDRRPDRAARRSARVQVPGGRARARAASARSTCAAGWSSTSSLGPSSSSPPSSTSVLPAPGTTAVARRSWPSRSGSTPKAAARGAARTGGASRTTMTCGAARGARHARAIAVAEHPGRGANHVLDRGADRTSVLSRSSAPDPVTTKTPAGCPGAAPAAPEATKSPGATTVSGTPVSVR